MHIEKEANQAAPLCPEYSNHEQGYLTSEWGGGQTESTLLPMLKLMVITEQKKLHPASLKATQNSPVCGNTEYGMFSPFPQERRISQPPEAFKQDKTTLNRYFCQGIGPE